MMGKAFWRTYAIWLTLIFTPVALAGWFLLTPWSHLAFYVLLVLIYLFGWPNAKRLQRRFWAVKP